MKKLRDIFFIALILVTLFVQFGISQDTIGLKVINTRPEKMTLKDGSRLALLDEWWKYLQIINQVNLENKYVVRKGSVGLLALIQPPDTVNTWEIEVTLKKREVTQPPPPPPPPVTLYVDSIDNVGPQIVYTGKWEHAANNPSWNYPHYKKSVSYTYESNATATVEFVGNRVQLYAEKRYNHDVMGISIDGGQEKKMTLYDPRGDNNSIKILDSALVQGTHKLVIRYTGEKDPRARENNNIIFDYLVVHSTVKPPDPPPPVIQQPPTGLIFNVLPGQSIKAAVEGRAAGWTVNIANGTYNEQNILVPPGVSIQGGTQTIINGLTDRKYYGSGPVDDGLFMLTSPSRTNGNQSISNIIINGGGKSIGGILVSNRDNITIKNVRVEGCNMYGIWARSANNFTLDGYELINNSWASDGWVSGELCLGRVDGFKILNGKHRTTSSARGYGIKALWRELDAQGVPSGYWKNGLITGCTFDLNPTSIWSGGKSLNISLETENTQLHNIIIEKNTFSKQVSLATGYKGGGKVIVRDNLFISPGTYGIESMLDNLEVYGNTFRNTPMILANFHENKKWSNWLVYNNTIEAPVNIPDWGGLFLIGGAGVENVRIYNNTWPSTIPSNKIVKYSKVTGGISFQ